MELFHLGKVVMGVGAILLGVGALLSLMGKLTGGRGLPGDLLIERGNFTLYFPIVTCLLLSGLLTLALSLFFGRR